MITVAMTEEMALLPLRLASPILGRDWGTSRTFSYPLLKLDMDFHSTRLSLHAANEGPRLTTAESLGVLRSVRPPNLDGFTTVPKKQRLVIGVLDRSKLPKYPGELRETNGLVTRPTVHRNARPR